MILVTAGGKRLEKTGLASADYEYIAIIFNVFGFGFESAMPPGGINGYSGDAMYNRRYIGFAEGECIIPPC